MSIAVDPILASVLQHRVQAISRDMATVLRAAEKELEDVTREINTFLPPNSNWSLPSPSLPPQWRSSVPC